MNARLVSAVLPAALLTSGLLASAQDATSLRAAIDKHYAAINAGNIEAVAEQHRPEMSVFYSDGSVLILDKDLETGMAQGATPPYSDDANLFVNDFAAQIYGNVGVATFYLMGSNTTGEETTRGTWRVTAVWVHEDGEWREAHHHESPLGGS